VERYAPSAPFALHVVRIAVNRGPAPARNAGVARASGPVVAFTDSDCRPDPRWLAQGLAALADEDIAFATGVVDFKPEQLDRLTFFARRTVTSRDEHPTYPTANAFYRRSVFLAHGGFSETLSFPNLFGTAMEAADTDLAWRIKESHLRNAFVPGAIVHHEVQVASPREWVLEPVRLFLVPALVKLHPAMRRAWLSYGVFLYRGSIAYYLALVLVVAALVVRPASLAVLPLLALAVGAVKARSLRPGAVLVHATRVVLNAARIYVMAFALICGSVRFRALVL
jgi:GT2 family glycosyltransferase